MYELLLGDLRTPPTEFRVFRQGENETDKGTYVFDDKAASLVMDAYGAAGIDLTIDYEHMAASDPPQVAPAAATRWVPQIRNGELWATEVKWTDRAFGYLVNGEYRYFSPYFEVDKDSKRIIRVLNLALTNIPATHGLQPLVAASLTAKEKPNMEWEKLYKELQAQHESLKTQLSALEKTNGELTAKLTAASATGTEAQNAASAAAAEAASLSATLSLPADAKSADRTAAVGQLAKLRLLLRQVTGSPDDETAIGVVHGWKQSHAQVAALSTKVADLEQTNLDKEFEGLLDDMGRDTKIEPAQRATVRAEMLAATGGKVTRECLAIARAMNKTSVARIAGGAGGGGYRPGPGGPAGLDPLQIHIAKVCGTDPAEINAGAAK